MLKSIKDFILSDNTDDLDEYFRTEIFELEYVLDEKNHWYVELYDNSNQKIKAMCGNKKKLI